MEVITNIMIWAAYANVCDVCVFCCCCVGAAGVPTTHILYGIPRYVDFQIIHTDSFIEFGTCPFPQIKKSSPQNKHQTWKHLEIGEHVTPENIIHWILSDQLHHFLNLFLSVTQIKSGMNLLEGQSPKYMAWMERNHDEIAAPYYYWNLVHYYIGY